MNSMHTSPSSSMEQMAFFVRCLVGFKRAVDNGGVNVLSDGILFWMVWQRHVSLWEQSALHGVWWLQWTLAEQLTSLLEQGLWWQLCLLHLSSASRWIDGHDSLQDLMQRAWLSWCDGFSGKEWALTELIKLKS